MRSLNTVLIVIAVICIPGAFLLILARNNPGMLDPLPDWAADFFRQHDWIGFVVCGVGVVASLGRQAVSSALKRQNLPE
jgi:hypothetical protein